MSDIAIKVENLTKIYKLYNQPIDRLKEVIDPRRKKFHKDFHALNDVSFEIKKGETVGIIGKNGAGKSTLLKILTGVLTPTRGDLEINGRISSLLELGAGFNPEYTGIQNIYLQGSIFGYSEEEMKRKLDSILEFSDIGEYIHQPYKMYSSGMAARVAFATAINVEPDILIVDEALSVGDVAFQNKCIRKMVSMMENGVTVLFVSHDTQAIKKFCTKAIWLRDGQKIMDGDAENVTNAYISYSSYGLETKFVESMASSREIIKTKMEFKSKFGTGDAEYTYAGFFDENNKETKVLLQGKKFCFRAIVQVNSREITDIANGITFIDRLNNRIITMNSYMYKKPLERVISNSSFEVNFAFKLPKIAPGEYVVDVALAEGTQMIHQQLCWINSALTVNVVSNDSIDSGCIYTIPFEEVQIDYKLEI